MKTDIIKQYLEQYPELENLTLAKIIYADNKMHFNSVEHCRSIIRYYKGAQGENSLRKLSTDKFLSKEKRVAKYNLPVSIETEYVPYAISSNKALIFSDVHIPFHNITALTTMFDFTVDKGIDSIIIAGDLMDCFEESKFDKEPDKSKFKDEVAKTIQFLSELKNIFPNAKIYYKFGNHEKRFENYMYSHAKEIWGLDEFRLESILKLFDMGIQYIPEDKYIDLSGLAILHGHEYRNGLTSPANPARTLYLRAKDNAMMGDRHQSSEHTETSINGKVVTCWSIGCLSELHPAYMPLNKWNHGFALYQRDDEKYWHVKNKRIIEGRVV